jgi:hypothetical protein
VSTANVVFVLGFVQSDAKINRNKTLQAKYGEKRRFYSCKDGGDTDYLRYVDKGAQEPNAVIEQDYVGYSGNDEKSSGLFDGKGMISKREKFDLRKKLQTTESTIWHGIISFEEAFGDRYCTDAEAARKLMAIEFPCFLKSAGFDPDKITWYAGLHENTDNKHIHFSFFENEPSRYSPHKAGLQYSTGFIPQRLIERFKVAAELRLTNISAEIAASRKELTGLTRNLLFSRSGKARHVDELQDRLVRLTRALPPSSRLAYDSENMRELRPQIREIVDCLIKSNGRLYYRFEDYCSRVKRKDADTARMLTDSKVKKSEWPRYMVANKYLDDIYRRIGNQIIGAVRIIKGRESKTKNRLANKRIRRRTVLGVMEYALKLNSEIEHDAMDAFEEYLERLESEKTTPTGGNYQSEME